MRVRNLAPAQSACRLPSGKMSASPGAPGSLRPFSNEKAGDCRLFRWRYRGSLQRQHPLDDILDVTGSDEELGKPSGSDERQGKRTYVSEFGLEQAKALADASHAQTRSALAVAAPQGAQQLERITDFIAARES